MNIADMTLEEIVRELPDDLRTEVRHYAEFLITRQAQTSENVSEVRLKQDWADALTDSHPTLSSVELQHRATDLWNNEE